MLALKLKEPNQMHISASLRASICPLSYNSAKIWLEKSHQWAAASDERATSHQLKMLPVYNCCDSREEREIQERGNGCEGILVTCGSTGRCMAGASDAEFPLG